MSRPSRAARLVAPAVVVAMVAFALFLQTGDRSGAAVRRSVGSSADEGRRALALLFGRVGIRAEAWQQVPAALPEGAHAVWRAGGEVDAHPDPKDEHAGSMPQVGMHAPEHYAEFVQRGGTLIVEGQKGLEFLRDVLEFRGAEGLEIVTLEGEGAREVRLESGEVLSVDTVLAFAPLDASDAAHELVVVVGDRGAEDYPLAVEIPVERGRAIAIADGSPFDNAGIGKEDHALLAVRIAEELPPGGRLLLDEYALGLWQPGGPMQAATRPSIVLFTLNALLALCLWTWMRAAPRGFPRDPEPLESFSPVLRARAQARLFERADRVGLLAAPLRGSAYDRIARRARVGRRREGREPSAPTEADVARLAAALPSELRATADELFRVRRIGTRADLERLARDLARFEAAATRADDAHAVISNPPLGG